MTPQSLHPAGLPPWTPQPTPTIGAAPGEFHGPNLPVPPTLIISGILMSTFEMVLWATKVQLVYQSTKAASFLHLLLGWHKLTSPGTLSKNSHSSGLESSLHSEVAHHGFGKYMAPIWLEISFNCSYQPIKNLSLTMTQGLSTQEVETEKDRDTWAHPGNWR